MLTISIRLIHCNPACSPGIRAGCGKTLFSMKTPFHPSSIRLIAGIGNPETKYANTYHNAGLQFLSFLSEEAKKGSSSLPLLFSSPVSMNLSGSPIQKVLAMRSISPRDMLLVHDDSDLPLGKYRISFGSSSAGHRGAESVIEALGTNEFYRLRFGIRDPVFHHRKRAEHFVLHSISPEHAKALRKAFLSASSIFLS